MKITAITATSDRPIAFAMCELWMSRQQCEHEIEWIVCDDGRQPVECNQGQTHIRLEPITAPSEDRRRKFSFVRNVSAGLEAATGDAITFIEDDDWYRSDHIQRLADGLDGGHTMSGEARARYYNLASRQWKVFAGEHHAALCQTMFHRSELPRLQSILRRNTPFVDIPFWREARRGTGFLYPRSESCVGLKGYPGTIGLGMGHRMRAQHDPDWSVLRRWIGDDAERVIQVAALPPADH